MKTECQTNYDEYLDNALLMDFARHFVGYGDPASKLWFVGIEEGGGGCFLDVKARMKIWRRLGRKPFVDAKKFHHSLAKALDGAQCNSTSLNTLFPKAAEKVKLQATWKLLIETALRVRGELPADPQAWSNLLRKFQLNNLGEIAMLELFPLPNPGTNATEWNERYPRWVREAQGVKRSQYEKNCAPVREAAIRSLILKHNHSIINKPSKPAWLKDLAVIDMGLYRRFYRQKRRSFAGAGDGAICGASTFSTSSSIRYKDTEVSASPPRSLHEVGWHSRFSLKPWSIELTETRFPSCPAVASHAPSAPSGPMRPVPASRRL